MKTIIVILTLVSSLNLFAEERFTQCEASDTNQLRSIVLGSQTPVSDSILNLLRTRDVKECLVARPVHFFPTVCGAGNFTKVLFKFKATSGTYDITLLENSISCHGTTIPMRVTDFNFKGK